MAVGARRLEAVESVFGIQAACRLMTEILAPWCRISLLVRASKLAGRPAQRPNGCRARDPHAVLAKTLPRRRCGLRPGAAGGRRYRDGDRPRRGLGRLQADERHRPDHAFLRPVNFDLLADARIIRIGRTTTFGRVTLTSATDMRPVGMVSSAYAML